MHSEDFAKQVKGYGLTTAHILYRLPDHPRLLQTYVWQDYDLFPRFPALVRFLEFLAARARRAAALGDGGACAPDPAGGNPRDRQRVPAALNGVRFRRSASDTNPCRDPRA